MKGTQLFNHNTLLPLAIYCLRYDAMLQLVLSCHGLLIFTILCSYDNRLCVAVSITSRIVVACTGMK